MNLRTMKDIEIVDEQGERIAFGELWREGPAALVFVRHFG